MAGSHTFVGVQVPFELVSACMYWVAIFWWLAVPQQILGVHWFLGCVRSANMGCIIFLAGGVRNGFRGGIRSLADVRTFFMGDIPALAARITCSLRTYVLCLSRPQKTAGRTATLMYF